MNRNGLEPAMTREEEAEAVARAFHESYERQAPAHGYTTRERSRKSWRDVPADNKQLMIAVARDLLDRGIIRFGRA